VCCCTVLRQTDFPSSGLQAEECTQGVLGERETLYVPAGRGLSLTCVVQHCGDAWTGNWTRRNSTEEKFIARQRVTDVTLSANQTRLTLHFLSVGKLDEGLYGCRVKWAHGDTDQGHLKYVNVTAGIGTRVCIITIIHIRTGTLQTEDASNCYLCLQPSLLTGVDCTGCWCVPVFPFVFPSFWDWLVV